MTMHNKLRRGETIRKCADCGRGFRNVGQNHDSEACIHCYELTGFQNQLWDNGDIDGCEAEVKHLFDECVSKGGNRDRLLKVHNSVLTAAGLIS